MKKRQEKIMNQELRIRMWGCRGSMPKVSADAVVYGGNTSCVSVQWANQAVVFDAGSGIVPCGHTFGGMPVICLFLSHYHLDHLVGFPMFQPFFNAAQIVHIYGETVDGISVRQRVYELFRKPFWPISPTEFQAQIHWHEVGPDQELSLPFGGIVRTFRSQHPDHCLNYRLQAEGSAVVYGLDCELTAENWETFRRFAEDCDLLIFDGAYAQEEYIQVQGYGHSTWQQGLMMAGQCGARQLWISHHAWEHTDESMQVWENELQRQNCQAAFGRDGLELVLRKETAI